MEASPRPIRVVAAVIANEGRYLITQRRPTAVLPLLWEFPGGRVEPNEDDSDALKREVRHRLSVAIEVGELISFVSHPYEHYVVDLYLYECRVTWLRLHRRRHRRPLRHHRWPLRLRPRKFRFPRRPLRRPRPHFLRSCS